MTQSSQTTNPNAEADVVEAPEAANLGGESLDATAFSVRVPASEREIDAADPGALREVHPYRPEVRMLTEAARDDLGRFGRGEPEVDWDRVKDEVDADIRAIQLDSVRGLARQGMRMRAEQEGTLALVDHHAGKLPSHSPQAELEPVVAGFIGPDGVFSKAG